MNDTLLNEHQAAAWLGCSPNTLRDWRSKKRGPQYIRVGLKMIRYPLLALRRFAQKGQTCSIPKLAEEFEVYANGGFDFVGDWREESYGGGMFSYTAENDYCELRWYDLAGTPRLHHGFPSETIWVFQNGCDGDLLFIPRQAQPSPAAIDSRMEGRRG